MSDRACKANIDLSSAFIAIISLGENNDFQFFNLSPPPHLNAFRNKFDLDVKSVKVYLGALFEQFGRPTILNATYRFPWSLAFWFWRRHILKCFYHI